MSGYTAVIWKKGLFDPKGSKRSKKIKI